MQIVPSLEEAYLHPGPELEPKGESDRIERETAEDHQFAVDPVQGLAGVPHQDGPSHSGQEMAGTNDFVEARPEQREAEDLQAFASTHDHEPTEAGSLPHPDHSTVPYHLPDDHHDEHSPTPWYETEAGARDLALCVARAEVLASREGSIASVATRPVTAANATHSASRLTEPVSPILLPPRSVSTTATTLTSTSSAARSSAPDPADSSAETKKKPQIRNEPTSEEDLARLERVRAQGRERQRRKREKDRLKRMAENGGIDPRDVKGKKRARPSDPRPSGSIEPLAHDFLPSASSSSSSHNPHNLSHASLSFTAAHPVPSSENAVASSSTSHVPVPHLDPYFQHPPGTLTAPGAQHLLSISAALSEAQRGFATSSEPSPTRPRPDPQPSLLPEGQGGLSRAGASTGPSPNGHHFASTLFLALQLNEGLRTHLIQALGLQDLDLSQLRIEVAEAFDRFAKKVIHAGDESEMPPKAGRAELDRRAEPDKPIFTTPPRSCPSADPDRPSPAPSGPSMDTSGTLVGQAGREEMGSNKETGHGSGSKE